MWGLCGGEGLGICTGKCKCFWAKPKVGSCVFVARGVNVLSASTVYIRTTGALLWRLVERRDRHTIVK